MKFVYWKSKLLKIPVFPWLMVLLLTAAPAVAEVTVVETKDPAGNVWITAENDYVKLVIVPAFGGMATEFTYKKTGNQWILPDPLGKNLTGMFADHIRPPPAEWPGECMTAKYDCQIVRQGPEEAVIKLWYRMKADGPEERVTGLKLVKEIILKDHLPFVVCKITIINDTAKPKTFAYWMQHALIKLGKSKEKNCYYRPSARGIRVGYWEWAWPSKIVKGEEYVKDPAAGWLGAVNPKEQEGLVSLMDYGSLNWLYNCITYNTVEWFYKETSLKPGEQWQTEIIGRPVSGFSSYSYASRNFIADTKVEPADKAVKVVQALAALEKAAPEEVSCQVRLYSFPERKELAGQTVKFAGLGLEPESKTLTFEGLILEGLTVIKVEITGKDVNEAYETYFDPALKEKAYYNQTEFRLAPDR